MPFVELSGLAAALCWTITSLMAPALVSQFGSMRFNTVRIAMASLALLAISLVGQLFDQVIWNHSGQLLLSGLAGIFIGDSMLFSAVHRLGPRRTGVLFATNAPMSIGLSWLFLGESLNLMELLACALVILGVCIAILFGKRQQQLHEWESTRGKLSVGIMMGLGGALGQASGALLSKPALLAGADAIAVSTVRVTCGAIALLLAYFIYYRKLNNSGLPALSAIPVALYMRLALMTIIGMVIGMSLLVWGIGKGQVGIVTTLSATVPVLVLPGLWITTGQRPAIGAWIGAVLVVVGAGLIIHF